MSGLFEIERKFLLKEIPSYVRQYFNYSLKQGWIPGDRIHERVQWDNKLNIDRYMRCIKIGTGITRIEVEDTIQKSLFDSLWPLTDGHRIEKQRFNVIDNNYTWEIDEFKDRNLFLAEVELPSEHARLDLPAWLQPVILKEVTGDGIHEGHFLGK